MTPMQGARAVVAGVLVGVLAIDLTATGDGLITEQETTIWLVLLVVVALLVVPDAVHQWKTRHDREDS